MLFFLSILQILQKKAGVVPGKPCNYTSKDLVKTSLPGPSPNPNPNPLKNMFFLFDPSYSFFVLFVPGWDCRLQRKKDVEEFDLNDESRSDRN